MASLLIHSEFVRRTSKKQQQSEHVVSQSSSSNNHDLRYYGICYVAGGMSSSIRWALSPLELIKMRMQVNHGSSSAAENSMVGTARSVLRQEGIPGLFRGLGPTAIAYWFQTSTKYGLYEVLKDQFTQIAVETTGMSADHVQHHYKGLIYVAAAGTAEAVADVFMCPAEMLKVKVQTSPQYLSSGAALGSMLRNHQQYRFPFGALVPLWGRQIPGTIANFYIFENAASAIYQYGLQRPKHEYSSAQQLGVTFAAGYCAGFVATVISHPADMLISLMPHYHGQSAWQIARSIGMYNLMTRGLAPRILVTAKVICFQWLLYDSFKSFMGLGTTGGD